MKKQVLFPILCASLMMFSASVASAQDADDAAPGAAAGEVAQAPQAGGDLVDNTQAAPKVENKFMVVLFGSGTGATLLWFSLFAALGFFVTVCGLRQGLF